jgi:hypothetical protein
MNNTVGYTAVGFAYNLREPGGRSRYTGYKMCWANWCSCRGRSKKLFLKTCKQAPGSNQPSIRYVPGSFLGEKCSERETDHPYRPTPWLRIIGTVPLAPLYVFIVWTGKTLAAPYRHNSSTADGQQGSLHVSSRKVNKCCTNCIMKFRMIMNVKMEAVIVVLTSVANFFFMASWWTNYFNTATTNQNWITVGS